MTNARAIRYRKLALAEENRVTVDLLLKLADECDRTSLHGKLAFGPAVSKNRTAAKTGRGRQLKRP